MKVSMSVQRILRLICFLSLIGIVLAVYLLWQQIFQPAFKPCSINATVNCDAIIVGPVAKTFGIPTPLYGLVGYFVIFLASIYQKKNILLFTSVFGLIFCLWIGYIELFNLRVICPVCITCQLIMATIFLFAFHVRRRIE